MELLPQDLSTVHLFMCISVEDWLQLTFLSSLLLQGHYKPQLSEKLFFSFANRHTAPFFKRLTLIYLVLSFGHSSGEIKSSSVVRLELPSVSTAVLVRFGVKRQIRMDTGGPVFWKLTVFLLLWLTFMDMMIKKIRNLLRQISTFSSKISPQVLSWLEVTSPDEWMDRWHFHFIVFIVICALNCSF